MQDYKLGASEVIDILIVEDNEIHLYLLDQYLNFSSLKVGKISRATSISEALDV